MYQELTTIEEYEKALNELQKEVSVLRKTVQIQHTTINRLMDAVVAKEQKTKAPSNVKK